MIFDGDKLEDAVGLALSGGGFRATLFHLGVFWRLNELRRLPHIQRISSVSGGSIAAGVLATAWDKLEFQNDFAVQFQSKVVEPILDFTQRDIDVPSILGGLLIPGQSIADRVIAKYEKHLFPGRTLQSLPNEPRFVFDATNLGTGANWRFSKPYSGDYRIGLVPKLDVSVATAVAASAAFPPVLSPVVLTLDPSAFDPSTRGDLYDQVELRRTVSLADGGVYDNMGIETIAKRCRTLIISDAGGPASMEIGPKRLWWNQLHRAYDLTVEQDRDFRRRVLFDLFASERRAGVNWFIAWPIERFNAQGALAVDRRWPQRLATIPTRLKRFSREDQRRLINWGYAMSDAAVRSTLPYSGDAPQWPFPDYSLSTM